jgi:SNF2 family DNA or RNA helicase
MSEDKKEVEGGSMSEEAKAAFDADRETADLMPISINVAKRKLTSSMPIKVKPYAHQIEATEFVLNLFRSGCKGAALLMDMGTGKSLTTIAVAGKLSLAGGIRKMLIVAPKSVVGVWEEEFEKFADFGYSLTVLDGSSAKKAERLKKLSGNGLQVAVVNYESVWRLEKETGDWLTAKSGEKGKPAVYEPCLIVCDESSKIKNPQAKQSKALHRLGQRSKYNLILTGTPVTNGCENFFSQYKFLDPSIFGGSYYGFRARYVVLGGYGNHAVVGYRNLDELVSKAHSVAFRVKLEDAVELPPYIDEMRTVILEPKAKAVYDGIERESFAELREEGEITAKNVLIKLLRLSQCAGGFIRSDGGDVMSVSHAKLEALEDILGECTEQGKKAVVFARFLPEIEAIERLLKRNKICYAIIHGGITDRAEQIARFQTDKECKVFVAQLQTASMGITLTAASVAVFYSLDYSYANYEQSRARIRRIGQTEKCVYYHLIAKGTADEKVMQALEKKGDVAKLLVDEWRSLMTEPSSRKAACKGGAAVIE